MSTISQLAAKPYYDDFDPDTKDFLRILFRPSYSVQARELNQMQAILQEQVKRFGNHIFKEGSLVVGGQTTIDTTTTKYLNIEDDYSAVEVNLTSTFPSGTEIVGATSGAKGVVVVTAETTGGDPKTLIYKPTNGIAFSASENINVGGSPVATVKSSSFNGNSSTVSIDDGIFFTKGIFVICSAQTTFLEKYSNTPNKIAGLISEIDIITDSEDTTLLDNANGSYNYAAPGAHRLKINLTLTSKDPGYTTDVTKFIELLEVKNGALYSQISRPQYSELLKTLARRTYDESGDYTVRPFLVDIVAGSTGMIKARISPGKAYVKGFEVETIATREVDIPKARSTTTYNNADTFITYGQYVIATVSKGLPDINSLAQVTLKNGGGASVGTARVRDFQYHDNTPSYRFYLFDINITTGTFADVTSFTEGSKTFNLVTPASGATGVLYNPENKSLVFDLGYSATSSLADMQFLFKHYDTKAIAGATQLAFNINTDFGFNPAKYTFQGVGATWQTYVNVAGATGPLESIVNAVNVTDTDITVTFNTSGLTDTVHIIASINNNAADPNTKTERKLEFAEGYFATAATSSNLVTLPATASADDDFYNNGKLKIVSGTGASDTTYTITDYNGTTKVATLSANVTVTTGSYFKITPFFNPATSYTGSNRGIIYSASGATGPISLAVPDVIRINKIITNTGDPVMDDWFDASKDVTAKFTLDNGQRNNYYDIASVSLKPGESNITTPVVVFFDYFSHTINDGFFCVNSYTDRDLPFYYQDSKGKTVDLFNAIDFRPTKTGATTFSTTTLGVSDTNIDYDATYYLARIDKLAVTIDGTFLDIQGIPSEKPKAPKNLDDALTLYTLYIPAYTYLPDSVRTEYIENKRYTMRDIGKIEKRVEKLEYYTALTALEASTSLFGVRDTDGLDRFKNGILVDNFTGHNVGNVSDSDYKVSIDIHNKELRPEFRQKAYGLSLVDGESSGHTKLGNLITKSYSNSTLISQTLASKAVNVNPFSVFSWNGNMTLTPNNDFWRDTQTIPVNVNNPNGEFDNFTEGNNPFGSLFNQWNDMWFGTETNIIGFEEIQIPERQVSVWETRSVTNTTGANTVDVAATQSTQVINSDGSISTRTGVVANSTTAVNSNNPSQVLVRERATRTIPATTDTRPITETVRVPVPPPISLTTIESGPLVTSVNLSEFIRPRRVTFSASGLKPSTTVYPFFDSQSVSAFVTPTGGVLGGTLTTSSTGSISGTFDIPFGRFFVGDRNLLLTDSSTGVRANETTSAEARYTAMGIEEQRTTLDIPVALPNPDSPFWSQPVPRPVDPLAQTFFVDPVIYPEGLFISQVDIYMKTKDNAIPLMVQLRRTVNGYPSATEILAQQILASGSVNTSSTAATATEVIFPNLVYLEPGEYAIVLLANSNNYEAWVAEIGGTQVGSSELISEQPYVGSLFKSQNSSTWTAEQTQDLTFVLHRAAFNTGSMTLVFTDWDNTQADNVTTLPTVRASNIINSIDFGSTGVNTTLNTIPLVAHPYATGSAVVYDINGSTGIGGLTDGATYYVRRINSDTIRLFYTALDAADGSTGIVNLTSQGTNINNFNGGAKVLYLSDLHYNSVVYGSEVTGATGIPVSTTVVGGNIFDNTVILSDELTASIPAATEVTFRRKREGDALSDVIMTPGAVFNPFSTSTVAQSFKATPVGGSLDASWTSIEPNKNYFFQTQHEVNASDESFKKRIIATVNSDHVSPVINSTRQSIVHVENIINNDVTDETLASGGNAWAKYLTKEVTLVDDSTYLKVYLSANKPSGTDVKVYYKVLSSGDGDNLQDKPWVLMEQNSPSTAVFSPDPEEFLEYVFVPLEANTDITTGTRRIKYTSGSVTYYDFISYAIKVVLTSSNTSFIPRCADFRVIVVE